MGTKMANVQLILCETPAGKEDPEDLVFCQVLALAAILFSLGKYLCNYFEIWQLAEEEMSFNGFPIFSSGDHFVQ